MSVIKVPKINLHQADKNDSELNTSRVFDHIFSLAQENLKTKNFPQGKEIKKRNNN